MPYLAPRQPVRDLLDTEVIPGRWVRRMPGGRRGAALPVVLIVVAVMTTVVVQFVHDTRTNLHMAANVRDEVRAYYNAKAGMDLARLALGAQAMVDAIAGRMNIQVWQYVNQFMGLFAAARIDTPMAAVDLSAIKGLGGMKGTFEAEIIPEDGKVNLNALGAPNAAARNAAITALSLLMTPAQHQGMFERKDNKGDFNDIPELIASMIDWIDPDELLTNQNADGAYLQGGGTGESSRFGGFDVDTAPRNAKLDTVEEIHLIKGIGDDWWEAFGEALTVYPSTKINVNTAPPLLLAVVICSNLANPQDPYCDPFNQQALLAMVNSIVVYRQFMQGVLFMTPFGKKASFTQYLQHGGRQGFEIFIPLVEPPLVNAANLSKNIEVNSPKVYKVIAKGRVGNTLKTLTAVIDISKKGRMYYWREF